MKAEGERRKAKVKRQNAKGKSKQLQVVSCCFKWLMGVYVTQSVS